MYLKSIEIQGFKSFAHKTKFEFHNGITGIVGPNGSGKSNIADAVRWVFGEQSAKQLRGSSMQDVIFAGTQLRKPQSFASVAITLDNADRALRYDFDEVTVQRKVYRSGESEYLMNGNQCRLKDINELFYDTGIGKEGYSIIGQGQIDKILSGRPEERRELFDEAAGIVKFKKRKTMTLKKLDSERESMVRITDIMTELERQVGPLARQSETAKKYMKLRDELKVYDLNAFLLDHASMTEQLGKTQENLMITERDLAAQQAEEEELRKDYADLDQIIEQLDARIEQVRESAGESGAERTTLEGRINVVNEQIHAEQTNREHYTNRIGQIEAEISAREEASDEGIRETADNGEKLKTLLSRAEDARRRRDDLDLKVALFRKNIEENHGKVVDLLNEKSETNARLQSLNMLLEQNALRQSEYEARVRELNEKGAKLNEEIASLEEETSRADNDLSELEEELQKAQEELKEAETGYNSVQRDINDCQQKYQIARSRVDTLRSMAERYEGFNQAVRRVMDVKNTYHGICGVVADLISVDKKYQTCVETALGGSIQNIVTETESDARRLVEYLKENRAGRATFLPLDSIRSSGGIQDKRVFSEAGVIGSMDTLVKRDKKYDRVVAYLLERFLAVDTIDNALKVARKYHYSLRIVTLDGELLNVGGSITGGAFHSNNNVLGRNTELESIEKEANEARERGEKLKKDLNRYRQLRESTIVEIEDIQTDIQNANKEHAGLRAELDSKRRELTALALEKKENESRIADSEEERKNAEAERESIQEAVSALESAGSENSDSTDEMKSLLEEAESELSAVRKESDELTLDVTRISQRNEFLQENELRIREEITRLEEEREELEENIRVSKETESDRAREIEELTADLLEASENASGFEETLKALTEEREAHNATQHEFFDKRDGLATVISDLTKEQLRLQAQQEKLEEKLDSQTEYLWTEYELTPSEAEGFRDHSLDEETPAAIRRHASELKSQIRGLGNVNVNAIEQYKEVAERYEFMKTQYEDIKTSEQSLADIVAELDEGMRTQFNEKLALIRTEYDRIFKELFGGGSCAIELAADQDVIDADISIISQPPGKKLQNMMQLSGGEKALSAIALIFAIQSLKPSPFCLLDEIEAALDDSNVGRFNGYLKNLTNHTQFILITHRRGTMVAADRLYGITMQEKGVSTLVSVNLVEHDLDA